MAKVPIIIDHKLRFDATGLSHGIVDQIIEALTIPNVEREAMRKQNIRGWQSLPQWVYLWEKHDDGWLVLPRGFAHHLAEGLRAYGYEPDFEDLRKYESLEYAASTIPSSAKHPWQGPAAKAILQHHQGIYKAPAGSGKTVTVLKAIATLNCKALVIVNTKDILWQWRERAVQHLGLPENAIGQIGDNLFEVMPFLTIATAQTLHSRYEQLERDGFFDQFSFVCLDECHHATAVTYNTLMNRFSARYRIGVSATPDKTGDFALATSVIGPIIHETKPDDVSNLIKPSVVRVPTKFGYHYRGARNGRQSNYGAMVKALVEDNERNELIARIIKCEEGHHGLAISKRLGHLNELMALVEDLEFDGHTLLLTGKESSEERQRVVEIASSEPCIVFSTLADEALDIPRLDRGFLTFPQRNAGLVTQQVGRFEREHPDKKDSIIYDFVDGNIGPLQAQWRVRHSEVYLPRKYRVTVMSKEDREAIK